MSLQQRISASSTVAPQRVTKGLRGSVANTVVLLKIGNLTYVTKFHSVVTRIKQKCKQERYNMKKVKNLFCMKGNVVWQ